MDLGGFTLSSGQTNVVTTGTATRMRFEDRLGVKQFGTNLSTTGSQSVIRTWDLKPGSATYEMSDVARDFGTLPPRIWVATQDGRIYSFPEEIDPTSPN
jgi:hypothetical protein